MGKNRKISVLLFIMTAVSVIALEKNKNVLVMEMNAPEGSGKGIYNHINSKLGPHSIEAPDLYKTNHTGVYHITAVKDMKYGRVFAFHIHLKEDRDRDKTDTFQDRQRNEIKVSHKSDIRLHGLEGRTFIYEWYFKISETMKVSKKFTHLFQLKPAGSDNDRFPVLTFTGSKSGSSDIFSVRYYGDNSERKLAFIPWKSVCGEWVHASVTARYGREGFISVRIENENGKNLLSVTEKKINTWRGNSSGRAMIRPKWGIYRSILDSKNLNEKDTVYFRNFRIYRVHGVE